MKDPKQKRFLKAFVAISLMLVVVFAWQFSDHVVQAQEGHELVTNPELIAELNGEIEAKRKRIDELKQQADAYQKAVDQAGVNVQNIQSQIGSIDAQLSATNFQIQAKEEEIAKLTLEMQAIQLSIDDKNTEVEAQRTQLSEFIKQLDRASRTPLINILLTHSNFGEFFNEAQAYASLSDSLNTSVATIQRLKEELQTKYTGLATAKDEIDQAKLQLEINKQADQDQRSYQATLLTQAQYSQGQYDALLQKSLQEQQQANSIIGSLERQLQDSIGGGGSSQFTGNFIWPVRGTITSYFHDPSYPFRRYFEHSGLDIGVPQGTPVRASASGFVAIAIEQSTSALSYVSIVHDATISTRYLHLSRVLVHADQQVQQGDIIGYSGGIPGTAGSGLSTGPHLHFEVRVSGLPDDPLRYLP